MNISLDGRRMEEVKTHEHFGAYISCDRRISKEVNHRIVVARKAVGTLWSLWKRRHMCSDAKVGIYDGIVEPSIV